MVSKCRTVITFMLSKTGNRVLGDGCFGVVFSNRMGFGLKMWNRHHFWGSRSSKRVTVVIFRVLGRQSVELSSLLGFQKDRMMSKCGTVVTFRVLGCQNV